MEKIKFGNTGITASRTGFGCLPIQRVSKEEAKKLLVRAYDGGIDFFDTARVYSDSEEKVGYALSDVRKNITIATKAAVRTGDELRKQLDTSLRMLKTDYIDIYQVHNPSTMPVPGGEDGIYDAMIEAKKAGKILHIGISNHSLKNANEIIDSGLYETLQYPFSHLATDDEISMVEKCADKGMGFICMKAMSGGLITNAKLPYVFLRRFKSTIPIWGIQRMSELEEFLEYSENPPELTDELKKQIEDDRRELCGAFCRSCGYCLPCPAGIPINNANRMKELLTRSPYKNWLTPEWKASMEKINNCTKCGACAKKCPYNLKPYETLPNQLEFYRKFWDEHKAEV